MTIETDSSSIAYIATGEDTFAYDFRVDQKDDMNLSIDGIPYLGGFTITGLGNPQGGTVTFNTAPPNNSRVVLFRVVPLTQVIDYRDYDAFPAETHELALDRLTMIAQQQDEQIKDSLRFPTGDPGEVVLPPPGDRADKFLYFDVNGDATVIEADPDAVAVLAVLIEDGDTGTDSRTMLRVSTARGSQYPRIGVNNINQPLGLLQLDEQGFVPFNNLKITGLTMRGPYRGDNLCDKPGDDPGDCTAPDHRNPSQRFPNLAAQFSNGDTFIITMEEPEILGQMELYEALGDPSMQVLDVEKGDAIIYLDATDGSGNPLPGVQEGWYLIKRIVDFTAAEFVSYDDTDNDYVLGNNVQAALDSTDDALQDINDTLGNLIDIVHPIGTILTLKENVNPNTLFPGTTWVQEAEGTFLMNTVAGSDLTGGANSKAIPAGALPAHTHGINHGHSASSTGAGAHSHTTAFIQGGYSTEDRRGMASTSPGGGTENRPSNQVGNHTHPISVANHSGNSASAGAGEAMDFRPLYRGVGIWERTA